jgi:hypothetical protein
METGDVIKYMVFRTKIISNITLDKLISLFVPHFHNYKLEMIIVSIL